DTKGIMVIRLRGNVGLATGEPLVKPLANRHCPGCCDTAASVLRQIIPLPGQCSLACGENRRLDPFPVAGRRVTSQRHDGTVSPGNLLNRTVTTSAALPFLRRLIHRLLRFLRAGFRDAAGYFSPSARIASAASCD